MMLPRLSRLHHLPPARPAYTCKIAIPNHYAISIRPPFSRNHDWKDTRSLNPSSTFQRRDFNNTNNPPLLKISSKHLPPRPKPPPEEEIEESFLKGSGPGGQKINKTNSAVQLKHIPTGFVVKCQATRSRSQNRIIARQLLADKLDDMTRGNESRSSVVGEVKRKKKASSTKKSRRKYRKLEEEKGGTTVEVFEESDGIFDAKLPDEQNETDRDRASLDETTFDRRQQQNKL
ncbi:RF-1 domain-containing protein [Xylaria digitata]|nr:RF-1 domain-containing protein [Xylaria digitata]